MANYTGDTGFVTRKAGSDLSAKQFYIVKEASDRTVGLASAATDALFGVVQLGAATNGNVSIAPRNKPGTFKVICGGTVSQGDALTSDANGKAITTTTAGNEVLGFAEEAGVAGQIIEYRPSGRKY